MQLQCKNKKLQNLVASKSKLDSYKIPLINLSMEGLDTEPLKYVLHHSYIDKNKHVAVKSESLYLNLDKYIKPSSKENFHEYLRASTNIITKNIYNDNDHTSTLSAI